MKTMRSHKLIDLKIKGKEKVLQLDPDFSFYDIENVSSLEICFNENEVNLLKPNMLLSVNCSLNSNKYIMKILFKEITELILPDIYQILQLPELEIEDIRSRLMEDIRFEVISYGNSFRCLCNDIEIVDLSTVS